MEREIPLFASLSAPLPISLNGRGSSTASYVSIFGRSELAFYVAKEEKMEGKKRSVKKKRTTSKEAAKNAQNLAKNGAFSIMQNRVLSGWLGVRNERIIGMRLQGRKCLWKARERAILRDHLAREETSRIGRMSENLVMRASDGYDDTKTSLRRREFLEFACLISRINDGLASNNSPNFAVLTVEIVGEMKPYLVVKVVGQG